MDRLALLFNTGANTVGLIKPMVISTRLTSSKATSAAFIKTPIGANPVVSFREFTFGAGLALLTDSKVYYGANYTGD